MLSGNIYTDMEPKKSIRQKCIESIPKIAQAIQFAGISYICYQVYEIAELLDVSVFSHNSFQL
mgnify:CR=1 FL=1